MYMAKEEMVKICMEVGMKEKCGIFLVQIFNPI